MATTKNAAEVRAEDFENRVIGHMDAMYSVAVRLTRNATDAQDLMQDAVVRALRFRDKFQEGTYLKAWLLTILRNTFINDYRKRARRPTMVEWTGAEVMPNMKADPDMGYYPDELKSKNVLELLDDDIRSAVEALPEGHRDTVIMADLKSMSYKDIAEEMNCPLGTVMSRLHRGRRLLRETLSAYDPQLAYG
jgi:RNA polymerase sigma-70 factor (ECF subfamily)